MTPMGRRCRVLYLVTELEAGGIGHVVIEHLRRLPRDRFELELALFKAGGHYYGQVPDDVPVHLLPGRLPSRLLSRGRALRRLVDERRIDVVSSHVPDANILNLAEAVWRRRRVGRVMTVHADVRGLMPLSKVNRARLRRVRLLSSRADRIVFLCQETADHVAAIYRARPDQVAMIPNGVDAEEIRKRAELEAPPAWPAGGLRLLALGRLERQKHHDLLLRALALARRRGLEASALILGEGSQRAALECLRAELELEDVVGLPGHHANPYPALRHADLFVLSSRFEGFALVVLEALAFARPVIATACPAGPRDLLGDGAGVLVPPDDTEALAAALLDLGRSPERRAELGARGPARAAEYDWSAVIARTAEMLSALANPPR